MAVSPVLRARLKGGFFSGKLPRMKTLLALGAHYDDCVFGIPGILLQGVRKHYRVIVLTLIGDYTNWAPAKGCAAEIVAGSKRLAQERGVEMRFLNFASHRFDARLENKLLVAKSTVSGTLQTNGGFISLPGLPTTEPQKFFRLIKP